MEHGVFSLSAVAAHTCMNRRVRESKENHEWNLTLKDTSASKKVWYNAFRDWGLGIGVWVDTRASKKVWYNASGGRDMNEPA